MSAMGNGQSAMAGGAIDVPKARRVLDEDHYDLDKIKDRIVEYLAVKKLREERAAALSTPTDDASELRDGQEAREEALKLSPADSAAWRI